MQSDDVLFPVNEVEAVLGTRIEQVTQISGGFSHAVNRIETPLGRFCVKVCRPGDSGWFVAERSGLKEIRTMGTINLPSIVGYGNTSLILEWLNARPATATQWKIFAAQLTGLHQVGADKFGFHQNGYCGMSPQLNDWCTDGLEFFVTRRLQVQARWARDKHLLSDSDTVLLDSLCGRLDQYIPKMPPVLVHGDLWSGNVLFTDDGPFVIDPAAYYGWAESDLAMTRLFGGFPEQFYRHYFNNTSLPRGFNDRVDLYNLYHLLNHLNLFGRSYYPQISGILKRFG